jgi:hypothetical protein
VTEFLKENPKKRLGFPAFLTQAGNVWIMLGPGLDMFGR